jgi:hypothetical protein
MRTATLVVFVALLLANATGTRAQAPEGAFFNVFQIRVPGGTGTAFTMCVDGRQYLITAKHKGISGNPFGRRPTLREIRVMKVVRDKSSAGLRLSDPFVSENFKEGDTVRVTVERLKGKVQSVLNPADAV